MISDPDQIGGMVENGPQQGSGRGNGAQHVAGSGVTGLPPLPKRVRARALLVLDGRQLPHERMMQLAVTARLIVHLENASSRLYATGELTRDGDPKVLLRTVADLSKQISRHLADIFGSEPSDPAAKVIAGD